MSYIFALIFVSAFMGNSDEKVMFVYSKSESCFTAIEKMKQSDAWKTHSTNGAAFDLKCERFVKYD